MKCKENILQSILFEPVTFMNLVTTVECSPETVNKYVHELEDQKKIIHKKGKFKIFYNPLLEIEKIDFYELMLNNSIRSTVSVLLCSKELSQFEIEQKTLKSRPTVSRTLSVLVQNNIVQIHYHAPYKTYLIKNKPKIISWIRQTNSHLIDDVTDNMVKMFHY
tara:strand:+ start:388 stop:876 length:489 start_codon:yes stop_codon:yes gene_type:complete